MHRTKGANYDTVGSGRRYTDGPPATTVPAVDLNAFQQEISHVIEQAGITLLEPENDTFDQLYQAISALITGIDLTGYLNRGRFEYKDTDEIYLHPGVYQLAGTTTKTVKWDSILTFKLGPGGSNADSTALGADEWHYIYLDDSAIVASGNTVLISSDFVAKTTAPSYVAAKHGWYSGNDRCIFALKTDGANHIERFWHNSDYVLLDYGDWSLLGDIDDVWTDYILDIPDFGVMMAHIFMQSNGDAVDSSENGYWRTKGSGSAFIMVGHQIHATEELVSAGPVITDSNQTIEVRYIQTGNCSMTVGTNGWYFPCGM